MRLSSFHAPFNNQSRTRASYYNSGKRFPPVFIRRFFLRYPHAPLYGVFALCSSVMIAPVLHSSYKYMTMSKEAFKDYTIERNSLASERQRFGTNLWFPFTGTKFDERPATEDPKQKSSGVL